MKCETIRNMISSYIDKDLNNIEKVELEKHLTECKECREEYESLLDIIAICGNLEDIELPQSFRTELHQRLVEEKKKKNFFGGILGKKGMKMATGLVAAVLIIAIGIGSSSLFMNKSASIIEDIGTLRGVDGVAKSAVTPDISNAKYKMDMSKTAVSRAAVENQPQAASVEGVSSDSVTIQFDESLENGLADNVASYEIVKEQKAGRMVIRTGSISVNAVDVDKAAEDVRKLTESSGGYVENSQIDNVTVPQSQIQYANGSQMVKEVTEKYANLTVRVPEAKFESVFNNIKGMGKLVSENMNGSDITAEYRDTTARVDNLKIQEQSLKQLMTKAKNVDEILRIESELNRVRTDIDINSRNLKRWDDSVQISTIQIYMRELKPEELNSVDVPGMWGKAYQGFIKAVNNVVAGLEKTVVALVAAIPYMVVVGVLTVAGLVIARKIKKKK